MNITKETFEKDVIEASKEKLILVDFYADWCAPCNMLAPILEKVAKDYENKITLAKIDVDANPEIANKFQISGIPAIKLFKDGKVVAESIGLTAEEVIKRSIDQNL